MGITDAKKLVGKTCAVQWLDRTGRSISTVSRIYDVTFVPLYGGYLVADTDDIRLDRILDVSILAEDGSLKSVFSTELVDMPVAA